MPAQHSAPLPEFSRPPVTEVLISVEFVPIMNWQTPHAGLYWSKIRDRYPLTEVHPPLFPQLDLPSGDIFQTPPPRFEFLTPGADTNRMWFLSQDKTNIVQVQRDRFVINWRSVTGAETYPRFDAAVRPTFLREWAAFLEFLNEASLGVPEIKFCEVSYINDVVKGTDWGELDEAMTFFSFISSKQDRAALGSLETINIAGAFNMPGESGRLNFTLMHALRQRDRAQIIQFALSARGRPATQSHNDMLAWIGAGRECIVRGFAELTTTKAHKHWGRTQ
ncbi:MAG: hypothetical protein C5B44_05175 [Acidobacteria bacterium]|nr:MAG: hypothetical protein C5B44_05175 [Acidobacteriota bacterium]